MKPPDKQDALSIETPKKKFVPPSALEWRSHARYAREHGWTVAFSAATLATLLTIVHWMGPHRHTHLGADTVATTETANGSNSATPSETTPEPGSEAHHHHSHKHDAARKDAADSKDAPSAGGATASPKVAADRSADFGLQKDPSTDFDPKSTASAGPKSADPNSSALSEPAAPKKDGSTKPKSDDPATASTAPPSGGDPFAAPPNPLAKSADPKAAESNPPLDAPPKSSDAISSAPPPSSDAGPALQSPKADPTLSSAPPSKGDSSLSTAPDPAKIDSPTKIDAPSKPAADPQFTDSTAPKPLGADGASPGGPSDTKTSNVDQPLKSADAAPLLSPSDPPLNATDLPKAGDKHGKSPNHRHKHKPKLESPPAKSDSSFDDPNFKDDSLSTAPRSNSPAKDLPQIPDSTSPKDPPLAQETAPDKSAAPIKEAPPASTAPSPSLGAAKPGLDEAFSPPIEKPEPTSTRPPTSAPIGDGNNPASPLTAAPPSTAPLSTAPQSTAPQSSAPPIKADSPPAEKASVPPTDSTAPPSSSTESPTPSSASSAAPSAAPSGSPPLAPSSVPLASPTPASPIPDSTTPLSPSSSAPPISDAPTRKDSTLGSPSDIDSAAPASSAPKIQPATPSDAPPSSPMSPPSTAPLAKPALPPNSDLPPANDAPLVPPTKPSADFTEKRRERPAEVESFSPPHLSFARRAAHKAGPDGSSIYQIVVRNEGNRLVSMVDVDETIASDQVVQAVDPSTDTSTPNLHWTLRDLAPHEERTIAITLTSSAPSKRPELPADPPTQDNSVKTSAESIPATQRIRLELIAPVQVAAGQPCRVGFRATNLGRKLSNLKLNLDLPSGLRFERGQKLEYNVGELDEHESREDYLTVVAAAPGKVHVRGELVSAANKIASASAACQIAPAGEATPNTWPPPGDRPAPCRCCP